MVATDLHEQSAGTGEFQRLRLACLRFPTRSCPPGGIEDLLEFTFEVIDGVQPGSGVLPGCPLKIFNEGFAPVDQRKPLAVMVDPLL